MRRGWSVVLAVLVSSATVLLLQFCLVAQAQSSLVPSARAAPVQVSSVASEGGQAEGSRSNVLQGVSTRATSESAHVTTWPLNAALPNQPLRFIANEGQTDPSVHFTVRGAGLSVFFTEEEVVLSADQEVEGEKVRSVVRLRFVGANPHPNIEGLGLLDGVVNYCLGNDPAKWEADVPTYSAVVYRDLYPGVDLVYRGVEGYLKTEFRLAAGVDPSVIQLAYSGVEGLHLRDDGALILETVLGELMETAPLIYQELDGVREEKSGGYMLLGENVVGFQVEAYDSSQALVIDPAVVYSSYLGGSNGDNARGITLDGSGNIYVTGQTGSTDFPTTTNTIQPAKAGPTDIFVTKLVSASGVYTYGFSTYLGGSTESSYSHGGIAVDGEGDIYVTGWTYATDFPTTTNAIQPASPYSGDQQAFVTVIDSGGGCGLEYSSYLGGYNRSEGYDITPDGDAGDFYVAGRTRASDFPTTGNAIKTQKPGSTLDAFVTHIVRHSGVYTYGYSTYLGGSDHDYAEGMAVDGDDSIYLTGYVQSTDFPVTADALQSSLGGGDVDCFVTKLITAAGVYTYGYSSYLGGSSLEEGFDIAVDAAGDAYVTGYTPSSDFPKHNAIDTTLGGYDDAFVTKIILSGGTPAYGYSTYLGGSSYEEGARIAVDDDGAAYVTGYTESSDFPTRNAIQTSLGGSMDAFVTKIISTPLGYDYGYSTYLGGSARDEGYGIAVSASDHAYVTGGTWSSDFPTRDATDPSWGGNSASDAFVVEIVGPADLALSKGVSPSGTIGPGDSVTYTVTYSNAGDATATDVTLTDLVPITLTNVNYTSSGAQITETLGQTYVWEVEDLAAGEGGVISITGIVSPSLAGDSILTNQATIASGDAYYVDEDSSNSTAIVHSTVIAEPPPTPTLLSPPNGAVTSDTTTILVWATSPGAVGYLVDWDGTVMDMTGATQYATPILADAVYTWTVAAYDSVGNTSAYTDVWSFTVDTVAPAPPALVSPADKTVFSDTTAATLDWATSADAMGYLLDWNGSVMDVGNVTQYTTPILSEATYDWTVAAYDTARNTSAYTDAWSLAVAEPLTTTVSPSEEETCVYTDSQGLTTTVTMPTGSVTETTSVVYTAMPFPADAPGGFEFAGHAFSLEAYRDGDELPDFEFETCVTITIHYSDEDVEGLDEANLTLGYWDGSAWVQADICDPPGYSRDLVNNVVEMPIPHLSDFALMARRRLSFYVPMCMKRFPD